MTPTWSPMMPTWSPKMMPTWLYCQDFAKFSLNRPYNDCVRTFPVGLQLWRVLCDVSDFITTLCRLRGSRVRLLLCRIGSSSSRKPCPSQMMRFLHPCQEFPDILLRSQVCIWWPAEQKICRQTKITSKEHLGWGIAGGLMNGTPVGKHEKWKFLVPVLLITGYQEREAVQDGSIEPLYHDVRLRMQSCCTGFVDGEYFTQSLATCRIEVSPLI
ncbi:hypothetical protein TNCV_4036941 [Trichonephila clavipes]|nr:hypothetical protein TNCV_4036941 [Trichonephila clavipes]